MINLIIINHYCYFKIFFFGLALKKKKKKKKKIIYNSHNLNIYNLLIIIKNIYIYIFLNF